MFGPKISATVDVECTVIPLHNFTVHPVASIEKERSVLASMDANDSCTCSGFGFGVGFGPSFCLDASSFLSVEDPTCGEVSDISPIAPSSPKTQSAGKSEAVADVAFRKRSTVV